jgi:membrane peptidoglycan carboxypeptidase
MGLAFQGGKPAFMAAGLAGALGTVEVRPLDLVSAYGTIANGGVHEPARMILEIQDRTGKVVWRAPDAGKRAMSAAAAYQVTDILKGNTNPSVNPIWAAKLAIRNGPGGTRRPAAVKTGTATDARDLSTYGYLAPPANPKGPALAVGVWLGNSDHSMPRSSNPAISLTAAAPLWRSVVRQLTNGQPVTDFRQPAGLVRSRIDAWSGGAPGPWTRQTRTELFRVGTQLAPAAPSIARASCAAHRAVPGSWIRSRPARSRSWDSDDASWLARARAGVGVGGPGVADRVLLGPVGWGGPLSSVLRAVAEAGPRQRQRARAAARPRAPGGRTAAREPAGGTQPRPPARRAGPSSQSRPLSGQALATMAHRCGVDVVPGICHAAGRRRFLASGCPQDQLESITPSGTLVTVRSRFLSGGRSPPPPAVRLCPSRLARRSPGMLAPRTVMPM